VFASPGVPPGGCQGYRPPCPGEFLLTSEEAGKTREEGIRRSGRSGMRVRAGSPAARCPVPPGRWKGPGRRRSPGGSGSGRVAVAVGGGVSSGEAGKYGREVLPGAAGRGPGNSHRHRHGHRRRHRLTRPRKRWREIPGPSRHSGPACRPAPGFADHRMSGADPAAVERAGPNPLPGPLPYGNRRGAVPPEGRRGAPSAVTCLSGADAPFAYRAVSLDAEPSAATLYGSAPIVCSGSHAPGRRPVADGRRPPRCRAADPVTALVRPAAVRASA
jgi:hypothetical protein